MDGLKTKLGLIAGTVLLFTASGSAAITSIDVVNTYPDSNIRETGTVPVVRVQADSNTQTTVELWLKKPDGTTTQIDSKDLTVRQGDPKETTFPMNSSVINQYGEYAITANETNNGLSQSLTTEISPNPDISVSVPDIVYTGEEVEDVQIVVRAQSGRDIPPDEIIPGQASIYKIDDDPDTPEVEKNITDTVNLVYDNQTDNLEASIPVTDFDTGDFEVVGNFNISSCDTCRDYDSVASDTFLVRTGFDRLTYQDKWGSFTANDILTNQGQLDENVEENEDKVDDVSRQVANLSLDDPNTLVWLWRGSVLLLLFITMSAIVYYSGNDSQY